MTSVSSMWTSYYASGPGASSESATTSVNNKSYSGTMQRSDDITARSDDVTVDSTVTKKHTVRFSLHNRDADRNTADSSTSTISYKRKLDDGESIAFKSLPEMPATALESEDVEKKPTDKKVGSVFFIHAHFISLLLLFLSLSFLFPGGTFIFVYVDIEFAFHFTHINYGALHLQRRESYQKELVMNSDQALLKNKSPPERYVYTRRSALSKRKQCSQHVVEGPGG